MKNYVCAIDFGATSGRMIISRINEEGLLEQPRAYRDPYSVEAMEEYFKLVAMSHIQRFLKGDEMTHVLCKAANIYMCARNMGSEPDGMTDAAMKEVQDVFKLPKSRPC